MPIRKSQFKKDCIFQNFVEVSEGMIHDALEPIIDIVSDTDPLGEVRCSLTNNKTKCVRGVCPQWQTHKRLIELIKKIELSKKVEDLGIKFEKLSLNLEKSNPDNNTRRGIATLKNELKNLGKRYPREEKNKRRN